MSVYLLLTGLVYGIVGTAVPSHRLRMAQQRSIVSNPFTVNCSALQWGLNLSETCAMLLTIVGPLWNCATVTKLLYNQAIKCGRPVTRQAIIRIRRLPVIQRFYSSGANNRGKLLQWMTSKCTVCGVEHCTVHPYSTVAWLRKLFCLDWLAGVAASQCV